MDDWRQNLVEDRDTALDILRRSRRLAILGIKPETRSEQPAFFVPEYLQGAGYEIVPVPVYYPDVTEILGERVYRRLQDVPGEIDLLVVFRKPADIPPHVPDILAKRPKAVWFQLGIRNEAAAEELARAGIPVVQDRCTMIDARSLR